MKIIKTKYTKKDGNDGYAEVELTIFKELGQYKLRVVESWYGWNSDGKHEKTEIILGSTKVSAQDTLYSWLLNVNYDGIDDNWISLHGEE